jgi:DMSO/TMAO reductase YedYZ molybdopterin-dependent catalytic subunit
MHKMPDRKLLTRRQALVAGLASASALVLPGCSDDMPPTYGHLLRMGDNFTYRAQRLLFPTQHPVREYARSEISSIPAIGTTDPGDTSNSSYTEELGGAYAQLRHEGFDDWRLSIEGSVARPGVYSLADLQRLPRKTQITRHTCEEGWTAIAEWNGALLKDVLEACGVLPTARFVNFSSYDGWDDSIDMWDATHPQTFLAYGMNGRDLPVPHGAPVRLRVATQMGYKSMKFLRRMVITDEFVDPGLSGNIQNGWSWYAGI